MAEPLLDVEMTYGAEMQYMTLGPETSHAVDVWLQQLRNWRNDAILRSQARRAGTEDETYMVAVNVQFMIAFEITGNKLILRSIFLKETLDKFRTPPEARVA